MLTRTQPAEIRASVESPRNSLRIILLLLFLNLQKKLSMTWMTMMDN
jgi:hypothetical protein